MIIENSTEEPLSLRFPRTVRELFASRDSSAPVIPDEIKESEEERRLLNARVVGSPEPLRGGSNSVYLVRFEDGGVAIFKPGRGEHCLEIARSCYKLYLRERSAFLLDKAFSLNLVPTTVVRTIAGNEGSLQAFIENAESFWDYRHRSQELADQLYCVAIFDYIIWNKDRKDANLLVKNGRLFAIDNGLSADPWFEYLITDNLQKYVFSRVPPADLRTKLESCMESSQKLNQLRAELLQLLPADAVEAIFLRAKRVCDALSHNQMILNSDLSQPASRSSWRAEELKYA